jgi:hypothetical protein
LLESGANQVGGKGHTINYSLTDVTPIPAKDIPEASTWIMAPEGFAALGLAGYRRKAVSVA